MQDLVSAVPKKILTTLQMKMKVPENNPGISFRDLAMEDPTRQRNSSD